MTLPTTKDPGQGNRLLSFLKYSPARYTIYQPYTIRILIEQGKENHFSIEQNKITDKLNSLISPNKLNPSQFRRNLLSLTESKTYTWFSNLVIFDDTNNPSIWKLNTDEFKPSQTEEILKECNKLIAWFHVKILTEKNLTPEVYFVIAGDGAGGTWYDEFVTNIQDTNSSLDWETAGVDYREHANFDLTSKSDDEIEKLPNSIELTTIKNIKKGSVIVINKKDTDGVVNTGIVTKEYYFEKDATSYIHRIGVKYLNISMPEINYQNNEYKTGIYHSPQYQKDVLKNLFDEETEPKNYFIITSYPDSKYRDKPGKEYEFPSHIKNAKLFVNGTNFIVQTKINDQNHFVGYGKVQEIIKKQITNDKGKSITMCTANYSQYHEFDTPKIRTSEIKDKMQWIAFPNTGNGSPPPAMLEIPHSFYREIMGEDLTSKEDELDTMSMDNYDRALEWKPNLILYGPPGTGKTFHANKIAEKVAGSIPILKEHTWKSLVILVLLENEGKPMNYHEIAKIALAKNLISTKGETPHETIAKDMRNDMEQKGKDSFFVKPEDGVYGLNIPTTFEKTAEIILLAENRLMHTDDITEIAINRKMIIQRDEPGVTPSRSMNQILSQDVKNNNLDSKFINIGPGTYGLRSQITNTKKSLIYKVTFHPSYSYEDFVEGYRPDIDDKTSSQYELKKGIFYVACKTAKENPDSKTVLIIDEINRGNIPKILGELITLLEEDKRKKKYALNLAYSQDEFFVPENLRIIGTMNTADKSLMQMDDALKRRFVFEELMPDTNALLKHLKDEHVKNAEDYKKILDRINDKILGKGSDDAEQRMKQFRDRQIGHSYFWNIKNAENLQSAIKYDIIPLLQDYFYGDYDEIRKILEDEIISENNRTTSLVNNRNEANDLKDKLLKI